MASVGTIIVAGGSGLRMGAELPKQFLELEGRSILLRSLDVFARALVGAPIVVVLPPEHLETWQSICSTSSCVPQHRVVVGGATRYHSVSKGLQALEDVEFVAIHDGVRPLVSEELIARALECAEDSGTAVPVVVPVDSFRVVDRVGSKAIDRNSLRAVQTPQIFKAELLRRAYEQSFDDNFTDDASLVQALGVEVTLCEGEADNIKITTPFDMVVAQVIISNR